MVSVFLRSLLYNIVFYLNLAFWVIVGLPTYIMPRWGIVWIATTWGTTSIWWMRIICNTKVEYRGLEKISKGPLIAAAKHQSAWETFALLQFFDEPLYILKRELTWLPFFGWYLSKADMIGIDRNAGGRSLLKMARRAGEEVRLTQIEVIADVRGGVSLALSGRAAELFAESGASQLALSLTHEGGFAAATVVIA